MKATDILRIRYTLRVFDIGALCSHSRYVYDILPGGEVRYFYYEKGNSKAIEKHVTHTATEADFKKLCDEINDCMIKADNDNLYVDDCTAEIKITRPFGRVEILDRGYGNKKTDVGSIVSRYIYGVGGMSW